MKKKFTLFNVILLLIVSGFPLLVTSQEKNAVEAYVDYFTLPRESLYLHTNKTTYIVGESEEIWFTVYAYDRKSHLSSKVTSNIHLGLYDSSGKLLDKKLFLAKEGIAAGNIALDPALVTGDYYLKVYTNWMKNFKEDDSFIQKIRVINPKDIQSNVADKINTIEYDVQFLPEGGHLLFGVKNNIGIKALDDYGKGTVISGTILNSKDEAIADIKTNVLGLGRFSFTPLKGETYSAKITFENNTKEIVQELPQPKTEGIIIRVNNLRKNQVLIDVATNSTTFTKLQGKEYKLVIHQNGNTKSIPVVLNNATERISIDKQLLFKGVNTVTLFDARTPLVERMFFNEALINRYQLNIDSWTSNKDSIIYNIKSNLNDSTSLSASISVLPKGTKSYNPGHSILSAFYLKPHLKGFIENPKYYFEKQDRKRQYALDLLLLTQGWSRYEWQDIFSNPPQMNYDFENGIKISGGINVGLKKGMRLLLLPTENNSSKFIDFDESGRFEIPNFFPVKDEKLRFSLVTKKGRTQPPKLGLSSALRWETDRIETQPFQEFKSYYSDKNIIPQNFLNKNEVLDEVVVSSRLDPVFKKKGPKFKGSIIKITDSLVKQTRTVRDIIADEKFFIIYDSLSNMDVVAKEKINFGAPRPVVFFVDEVPVQNMHFFLTTSTATYEDVYIDYSYNTVNALVNGKFQILTQAIIVNLFSRISLFKDQNLNRGVTSRYFTVQHGFEPKKEFYTPRYLNYEMEAFKDYGVIHWEPNLKFTQNQSSELTTIDTKLEGVNFYIEGIASDGSIFSQVIQLDKNSNK